MTPADITKMVPSQNKLKFQIRLDSKWIRLYLVCRRNLAMRRTLTQHLNESPQILQFPIAAITKYRLIPSLVSG